MFSYSLSSIMTPLLSMYMSSWRILLAIATVPNLIVIVADLCKIIPESIRWLICKGKEDEAMHTLLKIAKWNSVKLNVRLSDFRTLHCQYLGISTDAVHPISHNRVYNRVFQCFLIVLRKIYTI